MNIEEALKCADANNLWSFIQFINTPPKMDTDDDKQRYMRLIREQVHVMIWSGKRTKHRKCLTRLEEFIRKDIIHLS